MRVDSSVGRPEARSLEVTGQKKKLMIERVVVMLTGVVWTVRETAAFGYSPCAECFGGGALVGA